MIVDMAPVFEEEKILPIVEEIATFRMESSVRHSQLWLQLADPANHRLHFHKRHLTKTEKQNMLEFRRYRRDLLPLLDCESLTMVTVLVCLMPSSTSPTPRPCKIYCSLSASLTGSLLTLDTPFSFPFTAASSGPVTLLNAFQFAKAKSSLLWLRLC